VTSRTVCTEPAEALLRTVASSAPGAGAI